MLLDVFRCLQKVIIVVNMVTRKKKLTAEAHLEPTRTSAAVLI